MLKIRKVLDFFYRFRFVFIGVAAATAVGITTLDVTKGNITESSTFEASYTYSGNKDLFSPTGNAFMSNVTYEYRRKGETEWTEEMPHEAGEYEVRGRSNGSHGYKYTKTSTFEIKPYETTINLLNTSVDFADDKPTLSCQLLDGDKLESYKVNYDSLEARTTFARIDLNSIKIVNSDGEDVTSSYSFTTEDKEITFNKQPLTIKFKQENSFTYSGQSFSSNDYEITSGKLWPEDAYIKVDNGISVSTIGTHDNTHSVGILGKDKNGHTVNYTDNYNLTINDNKIKINPAPAVTISSKSLSKTYNGEKFSDFDNPESLVTVTPGLLSGHYFKLISFTNKDVYKAGTYQNTFTFDIVDKDDNPVDRTLYQSVSAQYGSITISKQPITITSKPTSAVFDNRYHSIPEFETPINGLATGDDVYINAEGCTKQLAPTSGSGVENHLEYVIKRGGPDGEDVTNCYDITPVYGRIVINQMQLKFDFATFPVTYDGQEHPYYVAAGNYDVYDTDAKRENAAVLADGYSLPSGWTYNVHLRNDGTFVRKNVNSNGYQAKNIDVVVEIWDNSEPALNVSSYFNIGTDITFHFPIATITPKNLEITVEDYNKTYDSETLNDSVVIDPNDPNTKVTYNGLVSGDLPDVKFSGSAANNKNASDTPYSLSLTYGVKSSSGTNLTDNYDIQFTNNKQVINASIAKKDINIIPGNLSKYYNGSSAFTPAVPTCEALSEPLIGETVSLKTNLTGTYNTTSPDVGTYSYDLNVNDIVIKIGSQDVTSNYNIYFKNSGSVEVLTREATILSTSQTQSGQYIFYDNDDHGAFTKGDGYTTTNGNQSSEISIQGPNSANTTGLVSGHRLVITNPQKFSAPGRYYISQPDDLGIVVYDSSNNNVTSNYSFTHSSFDINIVKPKIYVHPIQASKVFDGFAFECSGLENVPFGTSENAFKNYDSTEMKKLYTCEFLADLNDGNGYINFEDQITKQRKHTLMLTKYTEACANAATYYDPALDPDNYGYCLYPSNYAFKVVDNSGNDVSYLYDIDAPQGENVLSVQRAELSISCNGGRKYYNGQISTPPADKYPLTENNTDSAYIVSGEKNVGPKFSQRYQLRAAFDNVGYVAENMYFAGTYHFGVTITINDLNTGVYYNYDAIPSILITIKKNYYEFEVLKATITITQTRVLPDGRTVRGCTGDLASTDKVYFYDGGEVEELVSGIYAYTCPVNQVKVLRNGVDVTSCYNINTP